MNEERMEARLSRPLSRLLIAGLSMSVVCMLTGAVLAVTGTGGEVSRQSSISGLPGALAGLEPGGFFDLGLLVLLATPAARVLMLSVAFSRRRAWTFAGACLMAFAMLALSVFLGLRA